MATMPEGLSLIEDPHLEAVRGGMLLGTGGLPPAQGANPPEVVPAGAQLPPRPVPARPQGLPHGEPVPLNPPRLPILQPWNPAPRQTRPRTRLPGL